MRKNILIGDAIHVALENTDVHHPLSRNSRPDMNLCIKHIACELYWLCSNSIYGRIRLGSIWNENDWNKASKRLFWSYFHSGILDFHSSSSTPRSRIARIYSGIYSYSGISQTNTPYKIMLGNSVAAINKHKA